MLVICVTLACGGAAFAYLRQTAPVFEAEALVSVKEPASPSAPIEDNPTAPDSRRPGAESTEEGLSRHVLLLRSRGMIEKLIDRLDLGRSAELNPLLRQPNAIARAWSAAMRLLPGEWSTFAQTVAGKGYLATADAHRVSELDLATYVREAIFDGVQRRLVVQATSRPDVLALRFSSADPALAASVANGLAQLYVDSTLQEKRTAAERVRAFLGAEVERLRADLMKSEQVIQLYRKAAGIIGAANDATDEQQLAQLSEELAIARSRRSAAEARVQTLRPLLTGGERADLVAQYVQSPVLLDVQARELDIERRVAEARKQYGERHPIMLSLRTEIEELSQRKAAETARLLQALENEVLVARRREAALEQTLEKAQGKSARLDDASGEMQALERDVAANRQLLEAYRERQSEIASQVNAQEPGARIVSAAVAPDRPAGPQLMLVLAMSLVGGALLGSVGAVTVERVRDTIHSGDQLKSLFGLSPLGVVPLLDERRPTDRQVAAYALERPRSPYAESLRSLHGAMLAVAGDTMPLVLVVTSTQPGEGKTSTAVNLARLHAQSGARTLLIDADLRRSRLKALLDAPAGPGLGDILEGRSVDPTAILYKDERTGLELMTAGRAQGDPALLLGSLPLRRLLAALRLRYDLIVVDAPPVLGAVDARLLAASADLTLLVVRWAATRRQEVGSALKALRGAGAQLAGAALTFVDLKRHAYYGYRGTARYYPDHPTRARDV
jgi:capsular exopolysaccharide synthesis family protein